jgi:hypothetical protein
LTAALVYAFMRLFGGGAAGAVIVSALALAALGYAVLRRALAATSAEAPA